MSTFKPILRPPFKIVRKTPFPVGGALLRLGHSIARVKMWACSTPWEWKYDLPKKSIWVDMISPLTLRD